MPCTKNTSSNTFKISFNLGVGGRPVQGFPPNYSVPADVDSLYGNQNQAFINTFTTVLQNLPTVRG